MLGRFFYFWFFCVWFFWSLDSFASKNSSENFQPTGFYFSFNGGYIFAAKEYDLVVREYIESGDPPVLKEVENNFNMIYENYSGLGVSASLGYDFFNGIAFEAEWMYMVKDDLDDMTEVVRAMESERDFGYILESYFSGLFFRSIFYWDTLQNVLPFFSIAAGIVDVSSFLDKDSLKVISAKRSSAVAQASLGAGIMLTKNVMLSFAYSYMFFPVLNLEYLKPDYVDEDFVVDGSEGSIVQYDLSNIRHRLSRAEASIKIFF